LLGFALALAAFDAHAIFVVNQPWLRPAAKGGPTEVYMDLTSTEGAVLVAVRTEAAANAAIRAPGSARSVARLALPAGKLIRLAPGAYRIGLDRLVRTIALGDRVAFTLTIETLDGSRQEIGVDAEARRRSPLDDERRTHSHSHSQQP
jgi:periplasmic copper chaperone A